MKRKVGHRVCSLIAAFALAIHGAMANDALLAAVPGASIVGRGTFAFAFWDVYEATLYAPDGHWDPAKPHALSIEYFRTIAGKDIADRSVREMRKQGFADEVKLATWYEQMQQIFPDVRDGTVLSAVYVPGKQTTFYQGGDSIGVIKGDEFGSLFLAIWLGERSSEPSLRRALLGMS